MNRTFASLGAVLLTACWSPGVLEEADLVFDLVAERDSAELRLRTDRIDLGSPEARDHLGDGWSWNETGPDGETFVWMLARKSEVLFFSIEARAPTLRIRCRPLRQKQRSVVAVTVWLGGLEIGQLQLERGWEVYELPIPADALESGLESIGLEPEWAPTPPPSQLDRGPRQVAIAVDWIEFHYPNRSRDREDESGRDARVVTLASGSRLDYYLVAPEASHLVIDSVRFLSPEENRTEDPESRSTKSSGPARLDVWAQDGEGRAALLVSTTGDSDRLQSRLPSTSGPLRLRLEARGATIQLEGPRVMAERGTDPSSIVSSGTSRSSTLIDSDVSASRTRPRMVILYLIDTLRADQLGFLGHDRNTSPALDELVVESVVFENAMAQSSWTKSSVASLLTGQLPWRHGAQRLRDAVSPDLELLPQMLQAAGFRTGAFIANGMVGAPFGFNRGWDRFTMMPEAAATAEDVHQEALRWIDAQPKNRSIFVYLHTVEPHTPYDPENRFLAQTAAQGREAGVDPPAGDGHSRPHHDQLDRRIGSVESMRRLSGERAAPNEGLVADLLTLYNGEIAAADFELDRFLSALQQRDLFDTSLFAFVSDHGEEFYDHGGWTHGRTLHREAVHVPFVLKFPGSWAGGTRITNRVQHIDLLPTLLEYLQIEPPSSLPGTSLICAISEMGSLSQNTAAGSNGPRPTESGFLEPAQPAADCPALAARPIFTGIHYYGNHWLSALVGKWKVIVGRIDGLEPQARLYNLMEDPSESIDLAQSHPVLTGYLTSLIRRELRRNSLHGDAVAVELDEATERRLEALGYLQ